MVLHSDCPVCESGGRVGFRLAADGETMVLVCDECAHVWVRPDQVDVPHALDPLRPDFARRFPGLSLADSRWAAPDEVVAYGWGTWIAAMGVVPREESGPRVTVVQTDEEEGT